MFRNFNRRRFPPFDKGRRSERPVLNPRVTEAAFRARADAPHVAGLQVQVDREVTASAAVVG